MISLREALGRIVWGNPLGDWALASAILVGVTALLLLFRALVRRYAHRLAARTSSRFDDLLADLLSETKLLFLVALAALPALSSLTLAPRVARTVHAVVMAIVLLQLALWGTRAVKEVVRRRLDEKDVHDPQLRSASGVISLGGRVVVWVVVVLVALDNFGIDITALVAGLGVGGIAVALATQNILGDLFASVSILLDRPFVVGDFVVVGDFLGTVEQIGIKTTRLRSLGGEQIVFANSDLLQSRLRNYKRMQERRIVFSLGVVYGTSEDKLRAIPGLIREAVEAAGATRFDRAHFKEYGNFALVFETVYFVLDADYNRFMDIQQTINLALFGCFAREGIEFAYPTQTLIVQQPAQTARC